MAHMSALAHGMSAVPMAWIVVAAAFAMQMVISGVHFAFGVFLKPEEQVPESRCQTCLNCLSSLLGLTSLQTTRHFNYYNLSRTHPAYQAERDCPLNISSSCHLGIRFSAKCQEVAF